MSPQNRQIALSFLFSSLVVLRPSFYDGTLDIYRTYASQQATICITATPDAGLCITYYPRPTPAPPPFLRPPPPQIASCVLCQVPQRTYLKLGP